ncbi:MAG TPA: class I SAM-dependent methyltransferase [Rhizomicrobium sp.]|jgi:methyltransferase (TIGR00027 family)
MQANTPSRTAQGAAMHRAAHQLIDKPPVFRDPLALQIIGREAAADLRAGGEPGAALNAAVRGEGLRLFVATRSRFTEDCLAEAMARGVHQYVLLGAGLDTFAYRGAREGLRVFEVDHPATQGWKRARLDDMGIAKPDWVIYTPVDFERETLREALARAGFDFARPAMFAWLGVTPYLTREAAMNTLGFIASLAEQSEVVFDYAEPTKNHSETQRAHFEAMAARVAAAGEPFKSFYEAEPLARELKALGFSLAEDWDTDTLNARYFAGRADGLKLRGRAHLMRARV